MVSTLVFHKFFLNSLVDVTEEPKDVTDMANIMRITLLVVTMRKNPKPI
jgi:hypothetical protein